MRLPHEMPVARGAVARASVLAFSAAVAVALAAPVAMADSPPERSGSATTAVATPSAGMAPAPPWDLRWADGAVFYEVFVRSFQDSTATASATSPA